jgi:hypothetical protein
MSLTFKKAKSILLKAKAYKYYKKEKIKNKWKYWYSKESYLKDKAKLEFKKAPLTEKEKYKLGEKILDIGGMALTKGAPNAITIQGKTLENLSHLKIIKKMVGKGRWLPERKSWAYPIEYADQIVGYLQGVLEQKESNSKELDPEAEAKIDRVEKEKYKIPTGKEVIANGVKGKIIDAEYHMSSEKYKYKVKFENGKVFVMPAHMVKILPEKNDKKISKQLNKVTPATRMKIQNEITGGIPKKDPGTVPIKEKKYDIKTIEVKLLKSGTVKASDYTTVPQVDVIDVKQKGILDKKRPNYIPEIDEKEFGYSLKHRLEFIKIGNDKYAIINPGHTVSGKEYILKERKGNPLFIMNGAVLAATQSWYQKRAKERRAKEKEEAVNKYTEKYKSEGLTEKEIKEKIKRISFRGYRISVMSAKKMTYKNLALVSEFHHFVDSSRRWKIFREGMEDIQNKANDINIQTEFDGNTHGKGRMTSYGDSKLNDSLLKSHGVNVKRQDGSDIKPKEIKGIEKSLNEIFSVFGNKKEMAKNFGLKISHSGETLMHARKAIGMYIPSFKAIGVSNKYGESQFGFTLVHEFAHFMDNYLPQSKDKVRKNHYSSDDWNSLSGSIAGNFRKNMKEKEQSGYQSRTCECFARAFQQYFAHKTGKAKEYQEEVNIIGNHPDIKTFDEVISPQIERWLSENDQFLKSFQSKKLVFKIGK